MKNYLITLIIIFLNLSLVSEISAQVVKKTPTQKVDQKVVKKDVQTVKKIETKDSKATKNLSKNFTTTKINNVSALDAFVNPNKTIVLSDGTKLTTTMRVKATTALNIKQPQGSIKESVRNKKTEKNNNLICNTSEMTVSLEDNSFMNAANEQQSQNIYPGAIYTFDNFFSGSFNHETASRNPIRISSSAQGISGNIFEDVEDPTPTNIKNSVNKLYNRMPNSNTISDYKHTLYECNSAADMALKIGAGAAGYGASASFQMSNINKSEYRYFMIDATQEMYSLNAEMPVEGLFEDPETLKKKNLMMIGTVTYGQRVLVSIETKITSQEQGMKFDAAYSGFGAKANVNLSTFLKEVSEETTVKMYVVGGSNQGFITLDKNTLISKLNSYFKNTNYQNAKPIRYQFRNMNNEVIVSRSATDYFPVKNCIPNDANRMYTVTVTLQKIVNETNPHEQVKLGLSQWVKLINGNSEINNSRSESPEIVCWWENVCENPRMFKGNTSVDRTRVFRINQGSIMNGAYVDIWTKYIAMYRTAAGGKTNSQIDDKNILHEKVRLSDVLVNPEGGVINKNVTVNFNNRVFKIYYHVSVK